MTPLDICIDVSDAQPIVDWPTVYASGVRVAFVKAMQGIGRDYPTWKAQSAGARAAGLIVIPYLFLTPADAATGLAATAFVAVTGLTARMPFALDFEGRASQTATPAQVEALGTQLAEISLRTPIGYWGIPGSTPAQPTEAMQQWNRWIPRYPQVPQPPNFAAMTARSVAKMPEDALFWQYTSDGRVAGIAGAVDRSVWCGTEEQLTVWLASGSVGGP